MRDIVLYSELDGETEVSHLINYLELYSMKTQLGGMWRVEFNYLNTEKLI